jgi:hypothetical protein
MLATNLQSTHQVLRVPAWPTTTIADAHILLVNWTYEHRNASQITGSTKVGSPYLMSRLVMNWQARTPE